MLKKILILSILVALSMAIHSRNEATEELNHNIFGLGSKNGESNNPKNRTFQQVCEHYEGKVCAKASLPGGSGLGQKCCSGGITKSKYCDTLGCEHDTVSISDMRWDYWEIVIGLIL